MNDRPHAPRSPRAARRAGAPALLLTALVGACSSGEDMSVGNSVSATMGLSATSQGSGETEATGGTTDGATDTATDGATDGTDTTSATTTTTDGTASSDPSGDPSTTDTTTTTTDTTDGTTGDPQGCQGGVVGPLCEARFDAVDNGWVRVDRWFDPTPAIPASEYPPDGRGDVGGQRLEFFGAPQPEAGAFLFYYAPGWDQGDGVPILLVHGANDSPDRAWANPNESGAYGCGDTMCPETGMMQALAGAGYRVFALGLGHRQGDNFTAAHLIHDALAIVRDRTGAAQVDVIGWSMGAFSARMYASGVRAAWGAEYSDEIRRLILIGGPNRGFDYLFRYGINHDLFIYPECTEPLMVAPINAPAPHTATTCYGVLYQHPELSIYATDAGDFYPGQRQMLYRWDDVYAIPQTNQDWYTTYHGGKGFVSDGTGIDPALEDSLVAEIQGAGVPASIATYLLCGDTKGDKNKAIPVIPNETSGPSDGVVFIESCTDKAGIGKLVDTEMIEQNHLKLGWHPDSIAQVMTWLAAP
ncbi:MAG: alpha/beta fold hydrolase [Nannocystaceae bacterium]